MNRAGGKAPRILNLNELPLEETASHGGIGKIYFRRLFEASDLSGRWNFIDYAVVPPGASIGRHTHGDNEELYLVLEGEGSMHVDNVDFHVHAGNVIVNRPGGTHGLINEGTVPLKVFVVEVKT